MRKLALVGALILAGCQQNPPPEEQQAAEIEVGPAWARDTVGRTANAAVFMTITAHSADRLLGASTSVADETALMTMSTDGGAMAMSYVDDIDLPAGKEVSLDPSGLHVWMEGLRTPLKAGQTFTLELRFETAGAREVEVEVVGPGGQPANKGGHVMATG